MPRSNRKMAIGRSEDRDTPWDPMVLRHHFSVWDPIRVTHLGQRSSDRTYKGRTYDCNRPSRSAAARPLRDGGRLHMAPAGSDQPMLGDDPRDRADRRGQLRAQGGGPAGLWGARAGTGGISLL